MGLDRTFNRRNYYGRPDIDLEWAKLETDEWSVQFDLMLVGQVSIDYEYGKSGIKDCGRSNSTYRRVAARPVAPAHTSLRAARGAEFA